MNNRGQTLVEALVVLPLFFSLVGGLLFLLYLILLLHWCEYGVYRAAVCLTTPQTRYECHTKLGRHTATLLPANYFQIEELWKSQQKAKVKIKIQFSSYFSQNITREIQLHRTTPTALSWSPR